MAYSVDTPSRQLGLVYPRILGDSPHDVSHSVSLIFTRVADRVAERATRTCVFFSITVVDLS